MEYNSNPTASSGDVTFLSLLAILFIGLKLTDCIDWSWWWVLAPLWIPQSILGMIFLGLRLLEVWESKKG